MKKKPILFFFLFFSMCYISAQKTAKSAMLERQQAMDSNAIVERFDSSLIFTQDAFERGREENKRKRERLLQVINDSDLKEKQKENLRFDVISNPFSTRLRKFIQEEKARKTVVVVTSKTYK